MPVGASGASFGSNFPVDSVAGSYTDLIAAYRDITASLGSQDQHKLFAANARHRYRVGG